MHYETKQSSEPIFDGHVIRVTRDTVQLENGKTGTREIVHHHGGAAVAALNDAGELTLVRQYRYALGRELLEIPAGKLEPGEEPFAAAKRELSEEAGITADTYRSLGQLIPTCGYCTEIIHIYAAKDLHEVAQHLDEDEFVSVVRMPLAEAANRVLSGEIADSKTVSAILQLVLLRERGEF